MLNLVVPCLVLAMVQLDLFLRSELGIVDTEARVSCSQWIHFFWGELFVILGLGYDARLHIRRDSVVAQAQDLESSELSAIFDKIPLRFDTDLCPRVLR